MYCTVQLVKDGVTRKFYEYGCDKVVSWYGLDFKIAICSSSFFKVYFD